MTRYITGDNRNQSALFPETLEDYITDDNSVRVIDAFVEELDIKTLGFQRADPAITGRPAYHPTTLLKIYIYGYINRIQSSRRLELETQRNIELIWLTGRLKPDFKTIADFRKDNGKAIQGVCAQFIEICRHMGLFRRSNIVVDGSKFKAVNSRDQNYTPAKIKARIEQTEKRVSRYLDELDRADREQSKSFTPRVSHLKDRLRAAKQLLRRLGEIEKSVGNSPDRQISMTDPDARSIATSGKGTGMVGYNVQTAVDTKHHLVVAHEVTNFGHDRTMLASVSKQAKQAIGRKTTKVFADRGYYSGPEILKCEENGIEPLVPKPLTSGSRAAGRYDKRDFIYNPKRDQYRCPIGEIAKYRCTTVDNGLTVKIYWSSACRRCPQTQKAKCTTGKDRRIRRWVHEEVLDRMQKKLDKMPQSSRIRRQTVEHPFGTIKSWMGATHFLTKTLNHVSTEMSLHVLAYNLKRMIAIFGVKRLMQEVKAV